MAAGDKKITAFTNVPIAEVDDKDELAVYDVSAGDDKKITIETMAKNSVPTFRTGDLKWSCNSVPASQYWLVCDGSAVDRTVFADLFAVIGILFGEGDGSSTFNLPNFPGNIPIAQVYRASSSPSVSPSETIELFETMGEQGGSTLASHQVTIPELAAHKHTMELMLDPQQVFWLDYTPGGETLTYSYPDGTSLLYSGSTGLNEKHNNVQPYLVVSTVQIRI